MNNHFSEDPTRPDFIVCGGPNGDGGVYLIASRLLLRADLDIRTIMPDLFTWRGESIRNRVFLNTEMSDAVKIIAPTYPEAFRMLAELWGNRWNSNQEIESQNAIESGE
jgi:hypothetical protein